MVIEELVKTVLAEVKSITRTESIVGKPMEIGEVTLIPVARISMGFAVGGGVRDTKEGKGEATGGGATIEPIAFFVVKGDHVDLVTLKKGDAGLDRLFELVPQIMDRVKVMKDRKQEKRTGKNKA